MKKILILLTLFLSSCYTTTYYDDVYYRERQSGVTVYNWNADFYRFRYNSFWHFNFNPYWNFGIIDPYWHNSLLWGNYWHPHFRYSGFHWYRPYWNIQPVPTTPQRPAGYRPRTNNTQNYRPTGIPNNKPIQQERTNTNRNTIEAREYRPQPNQPRQQRTPTYTQPPVRNTTPPTQIQTRNSGGRSGRPIN
jgi:hypothetical protein